MVPIHWSKNYAVQFGGRQTQILLCAQVCHLQTGYTRNLDAQFCRDKLLFYLITHRLCNACGLHYSKILKKEEGATPPVSKIMSVTSIIN